MSDIERHDYDDQLDPEALFSGHKRTGEPLGGHEVRMIVDAGLASRNDFDSTGGDMWIHRATFPDPDSDDTLPAIDAGDPCPACGGQIVVDGSCHYTRVPVHADGTPTDEGQGGDFEWDDRGAYCADCEVKVRVE